tara:strand:+ start:497 stop:1741 length:1245 start_codon:yes stop_codon:yes gene_type:complete
MADTVKTIGSTGDYADPILWAAGQGNVNDGNRQVGEMLEDITINALFRPNQSFPNLGLLRGNITVTGEVGVGRVLTNQAATRFCLSPSPNIEFRDLRISDGGTAKTTTFQNIDGNTFTRVISMDTVTGGTINPLNNSTGATANNCALYMVTYNGSTVSGDITLNNCYVQERILCRDNNLLTILNSISQASDWYLGQPLDSGAVSLVNFCRILENANANEFGAGSSDNIVNIDSSAEFVNLAGGDYRIKSTSTYATDGQAGGLIGPFLEASSGISLTVTEVLNSFTDTSNINIDYNVSAIITETLNSFGDTSVISVTSGQVVNLTVTETLSAFTDVSNINVSANIELLVTEVLNSFLDGANVTIAKDITLQVTELLNSFADNSSLRLPANWVDKIKVATTYTTQTPVSTTWIDKG